MTSPAAPRRAGAIAVAALAALLLQACGSSEPTSPRSVASVPASTTVPPTSPTTTTATTTTSATPTTVAPVVPAQVPLPTTRVAVKTVAPQGLVAPPKPKTQAADAGGSGGGSAYYKNCDAVRAAGKAPILRGQPGYASHLDRDNDGIGCEPKK
ncbi:excalibur calcium-binding domain-containing protein [Pseudonocardia sp.]|jgi:hypothetical protein|uniref:excalibur calcium-binding domain-containing protein n=1 Tax=Pseudonocardia sp. TaxID=60912 RepID=UPI003D0A215B